MLGTIIYAMLYVTFHTCRLIGWWRWRYEGWENLPPRQGGGMILAMNHVHWVDIPAVGALVPWSHRLSWLGKAEIFKHPVMIWFFRTMNVIPIKRGRRDVAALDAAVEALRSGAVLLIFPEGHRSHDGVLQPGHGGAVRLAMQAGVPIVPVAITGSEHGLRGTLTRKPLTIRFGKPYIIPPTANGKIRANLMDKLIIDLMQRIAAMLPADRRGPYAELPQGEL